MPEKIYFQIPTEQHVSESPDPVNVALLKSFFRPSLCQGYCTSLRQ